MARFGRRRLDPAITAVIDRTDPADRVVAFATVAGGRYVVATRLGLWWPVAGDDLTALRRIPWERIDKAVWRDGVLVVTEADVEDGLLLVDRDPVALPLDEPGEVPAEVKRRIEATVIRSEIVPVSGGQVRIVARRVPGRDGLTWWARLEGSTPDNAIVRDAVQTAIERFTAVEQARTPI